MNSENISSLVSVASNSSSDCAWENTTRTSFVVRDFTFVACGAADCGNGDAETDADTDVNVLGVSLLVLVVDASAL
jgi:hypothetical protein